MGCCKMTPKMVLLRGLPHWRPVQRNVTIFGHDLLNLLGVVLRFFFNMLLLSVATYATYQLYWIVYCVCVVSKFRDVFFEFFFPNLEDQGMDPNTKGRPHRDGPFAKDTQEKTEQPLSTWPADMSKKATDQQRQDRYVFLSQRYFFNSKPSIGPTAFPWHQSFGLGRISSWEKEIGEGRGGMDLICINYFRALLEFWLGITNHGNIHHNVSIQSV